jgi:hypothetical protein
MLDRFNLTQIEWCIILRCGGAGFSSEVYFLVFPLSGVAMALSLSR